MIIKTEKEIVETYAIDSSNYKGYAERVYIPENENEIISLFKELNNKKEFITISGAGTGLAGARVPNGGNIISTEKLNKIINFDKNKKYLTVQASVTSQEISTYLNEYNYFLPTNPTETTATIAGNVSTNASGSRTYMYGPIRNFVQKLKVILANGEVLILDREHKPEINNNYRFKYNNHISSSFCIKSESNKVIEIPILNYPIPTFKHSAGYFTNPNLHPIDYFIGAEGTLGFISEITLKVLEKPENILGLIIFFDKVENCIKFVEELQKKKIYYNNSLYKNNSEPNPRLIEFFDKYSLKMLREKYSQIDEDADSAIWVEQELYNYEDEIINSWYELIIKYTKLSDDTWVAKSISEHNKFTEFRHTLPEKVYELIALNNQYKVGIDGAVPDGNLSFLYKMIVEKSEKYNLDRVIYGHIGNNHLHGNVFYKNDIEKVNANKFYDEAIEEILKVNGTVSAEHGIGKLKVPYLKKMFGKSVINQMIELKKSLDENNIINVGNLFNI